MRKAALKASRSVDEPNLILPLASSINERGVAGYTHSVTNSEDQRKVNCFYELAKNPMTGKGTLTLAKRPGVTSDGGTYGSSSQQAYLSLQLNLLTTSPTIFVFNTQNGGNDTKVSSNSTTTTILSSASPQYIPTFVDLTSISNVSNKVIQLVRYDAINKHRVYFTSADDTTGWTEITDADFTANVHMGKMEHLDGFAFIMTTTNLIFNSDVNSLANWTATSFLAKSIQQDKPIGLARLGTKLIGFGERTAEVFYNAGNTTGSPLGRIPQLSDKVGLVPMVQVSATLAAAGGTHYYATLGNRLYFVGLKAGAVSSSIGFFMFDGSNFSKVSSPYIDKIISEKGASLYSVNPVGFQGQNGISICLTPPSASTQISLIYLPDWNEWFEWNSAIYSPVNNAGYHIGVSLQNKVYTFASSDNWQDSGTSYAWSTQFKLPTNGSSRKFMPMYGVDADTDTSTNDLTVEISTDDSKTFSTLGTIDQTQDRKVLFRGGSFRKAHIRLGNTNSRPTRIQNFLARIE